MDDRRAVKDAILHMPGNNLLIELPTGHGKTALAIEVLRNRCGDRAQVLVVVPRIPLKDNFIKEVNKWWKDCPLEFTLITYRSLHKYKGHWTAIVWDEVHHLSARCRALVPEVCAQYNILLSATVKPAFRDILTDTFKGLECYKRLFRDAIDNGVLPDPKVFLMPLTLDNEAATEEIIKNPNCKDTIVTTWRERWQYLKRKDVRIVIKCTKKQKIIDLDSNIEWWKKKYFRTKNQGMKSRWLHLCGERLKLLSDYRTQVSLDILEKLKNYRTLTFCNDIEHTKILGEHCINSENKLSLELLQRFNAGKIKHITSCNMLNEGVNLTNCRVGIFAVLNSSEILIKQKLGRILRHKKPVVIIPYYIGTREQEIVEIMLEDYNPELVETIYNVNEIRL